MKIGILITGNEVISGKTRDTNGPYMGALLRKHGLTLNQILFCSDDRTELLLCLEFLQSNNDVILMTGGLGPTSDDLTGEVVSEFCRVPAVFNQAAWDNCVLAFHAMGRFEVPESNRKQALLPSGCAILPNPVGTAAGFFAQGPKSRIFAMPGVPSELEPMFVNHVLPLLRKDQPQAISRTWQVFQLGESSMQQRLGGLEQQIASQCKSLGAAHISYQAHAGWVTYSIGIIPFQEQHRDAVLAILNQSAVAIDEALDGFVLNKKESNLYQSLIEICLDKGLKFGFAESCTGGLVSNLIAQTPGASKAFQGSIVCYSNLLKTCLLKVSEKTLGQFGAVSRQTAQEMALGALETLQCDVTLSITGVAGPKCSDDLDTKEVGCVCFAIAIRSDLLSHLSLSKLERFKWAMGTVENCFVMQTQFSNKLHRTAIQTRSAVMGVGGLLMGLSAP